MNIPLFIERIAQHRIRILTAFAALIVSFTSAFLIYSALFTKTQNVVGAMPSSEVISSFLNNSEMTKKRVEEVKSALLQNPHLIPGQQQRVAQKLLSIGLVKEALPLIEAAAKRVSSLPPYYRAYSKISILVEKGKLIEAHKKVKILKDQLFSDSTLWDASHKVMQKSGSLAALTLIKKCALEQALGLEIEELSTLHELESFLGFGHTENTSSALETKTKQALLDHYKVNTSTLREYIHERERVLRRK